MAQPRFLGHSQAGNDVRLLVLLYVLALK